MIGTVPSFVDRVAHETLRSSHPFQVECHYCGYEPADGHVLPWQRCPKCGGSAWERFTRPRSLIVAALEAQRDRYRALSVNPLSHKVVVCPIFHAPVDDDA